VDGVAPLPSLATLNEMPPDAFAEAVGPLFERAARFLARLADARPFRSWEELFERSLEIAVAMPHAEQVELIDSHPRLGADADAVRASSELSWREQGYDRTRERATDDALIRLNEAYERRFGFRFVVFVAGRSRAELVPVLRTALQAQPRSEVARALEDIVAIARDRAATLRAVARR
jgi:2-oxo-4-hydroxy-4-carboxy--5-ureidoimidazoline (OHCU) decarboxylase